MRTDRDMLNELLALVWPNGDVPIQMSSAWKTEQIGAAIYALQEKVKGQRFIIEKLHKIEPQ